MKTLFTTAMFLAAGAIAYALMAFLTEAPQWACYGVSLLFGQAASHDFDRSMTAEGRW